MPIPGDNGRPQAERDAQNKRIIDEANHGADVKKELRFLPPEKQEKSIFQGK